MVETKFNTDDNKTWIIDTNGVKSSNKKSKKLNNTRLKPYFLDQSLPRHIKHYMDKLHIEFMTDHFMKYVSEFKKKKKATFMKSVAKAYNYHKQQEFEVEAEIILANEEESDDDIIVLPIGTPNKKIVSTVDEKKEFSLDSALYNQSPKIIKCGNIFNTGSTTSPLTPSVKPPQSDKKKKRILQHEEDLIPKKKKKDEKYLFSIPSITLDDVLCLEGVMDKLLHLGKNFSEKMIEDLPPKNLLISGPEGSGKSFLIQAFAGREKIPLLSVSVQDFIFDEQAIDGVFTEALTNAPCILHLSNLHLIAPVDNSHTNNMNNRLNAKIADHILKMKQSEKRIVVVGEYQYHPSKSINWNLRSCFEREIVMFSLKEEKRLQFLKKICSTYTMEVDLDQIAKKSVSYLPGDLIKMVEKASEMAMNRHYQPYKENLTSQNDYKTRCEENYVPKFKIVIKEEDFALAMREMVPVLKREGFPSVPEIKMDEIGGMEHIKAQVYDNILLPLEYKKFAAELGIDDSGDTLLWGPPGCGKTLLAKAIANQAGINFLLISGAEVLKMYQGESERKIRETFALAKSVSPCIIYFDEFEGICPKRTGSSDNNGSKSTIVTTLLTEMSGVLNREGVFVMASTNRPDVIDPALLRSGRIGTKIYVGLPDQQCRKAIFAAKSKNKPIASDIDFDSLSSKCDQYSGADCAELIKSAARCAIKRMKETGINEAIIQNQDITKAFTIVKPSVTKQALMRYEKLKKIFGSETKK